MFTSFTADYTTRIGGVKVWVSRGLDKLLRGCIHYGILW